MKTLIQEFLEIEFVGSKLFELLGSNDSLGPDKQVLKNLFVERAKVLSRIALDLNQNQIKFLYELILVIGKGIKDDSMNETIDLGGVNAKDTVEPVVKKLGLKYWTYSDSIVIRIPKLTWKGVEQNE